MNKDYYLKISTDKTKIMVFKGKHLVPSEIEIGGSIQEQVKQFNYLGCELSLGGEPDFDKSKQIPRNMRHYQETLEESRTETQMKVHKIVARPSLRYGSETWVATHRDMIRLEAAEMRFLRSVTGYARLDKIRSEVIREELEISGIKDADLQYKQNLINHLERADNTRPPKHALKYKPRGRRDRGRPRKR